MARLGSDEISGGETRAGRSASAPAESGRPPVERRAPEPALYTGEQLLGRAPIHLRRRRDKVRLAFHVLAVAVLIPLTAWWVVPLHGFAGPTVVSMGSHGVHLGDLPSLAFLALALRSMVRGGRLVIGLGARAGSLAG